MKKLVLTLLSLFACQLARADSYTPLRLGNYRFTQSITIDSSNLFIGSYVRDGNIQLQGYRKGHKEFAYSFRDQKDPCLLATNEKNILLIGSEGLSKSCLLQTINLANGNIETIGQRSYLEDADNCRWYDSYGVYAVVKSGGVAVLKTQEADKTPLSISFIENGIIKNLVVPSLFAQKADSSSDAAYTFNIVKSGDHLVSILANSYDSPPKSQMISLDTTSGLFGAVFNLDPKHGYFEDDTYDGKLLFYSYKDFLYGIDPLTGDRKTISRDKPTIARISKHERSALNSIDADCSIENKYKVKEPKLNLVLMKDGNAYADRHYLKRVAGKVKSPFCYRAAFKSVGDCRKLFQKAERNVDQRYGLTTDLMTFPNDLLSVKKSCSFEMKLTRPDGLAIHAMDLRISDQFGKSASVHVPQGGKTTLSLSVGSGCVGPSVNGPNGFKDLVPLSKFIWASHCE